MIPMYFCVHMKWTKSTCFCCENLGETHENTTKTVNFMCKVDKKCILVQMGYEPKVKNFSVKTLRKHMKTQAKQCISCIEYGTYVFLSTCDMYQKTCFCSKNKWIN
jgi:hypothetical protein